MKKIVPLTLLLLIFTHGTISLPKKTTTVDNSETEEKIEETEDKSIIKVEEHNYTYYWYQTHRRSFWIDTSEVAGPIAHVLRDSYLFGHPLRLTNHFIFYGHRIQEVLVTTGGFLYMDEMTHRQLTYSQYIAPLMANFETKSTNNTLSTIKYFTNSTILIVWWDNMKLRHSKNGERFTFQLVYHSNGSIFFNYDKIPESTFKQLKEGESMHKVTVGLSDAYYLFEDTGGKAMHISVVFEYHHLSIPLEDVLQFKSIEIKALPSCIEQKTCETCTNAKISSKLNCQWCPTAQLCSDGFDRMRQKWLEHDCTSNGFVSGDKCSALILMNKSDLRNMTRVRQFNLTDEDDDDYEDKIMALKDEIKFSAALLGCGVVLFLALWLLYALKYPNSASGRWLIEHRPTKLIERCRRGFMRRVGHRPHTETYVSFDREMNNDMVL